jgi:uncharacterized SAM-binding protein YcdF (DUF218 family)
LTISPSQGYYAQLAMNNVLSQFRLPRRALLWLGAFNILLFVLVIAAFLHAGTWLVREDPSQKAQIVVVLSGGLPERALAAADEFKASGAKEVWLTRPLQPGAAMQQLQLPYAGEEQYSRMVLIDRGVPPTAIRLLDPHINNTAEEIQAVFAELQKQPEAVVVAVSSKAHTRRVRVLWNVISKGSNRGKLLVRAAPQDSFDSEHWWRSSNDALSVVREYLGLLNAWAGLPLHHSS